MPASVKEHIERLKAYVPGQQPREGQRIIKLNTNENPYPPSPWVLETIREEASDALRLYSDPQSNKLREAAASLYGVAPERVLCGNGSDEILGILLRTFTTQMEALKRYRTGGQQKVTVEHVHVNEGGQAIVGVVNRGEGSSGKRG